MAHTAPILLTELNLITNYLLYFCLLLNLYFFSKEGLGQLHLSVGMLLNAPMGKTVCKIYFLGFNITWTLLHKASPKSIAQLRHAEDTFLKVPIAFSAGNKLGDLLLSLLLLLYYYYYYYVSSMCPDLVEKRVRFPQGLNLVLYLYFRIFYFCIVE